MKMRKRFLPLFLASSLVIANLVPMQSDAAGKKEKSEVIIDVTRSEERRVGKEC